MTREPSGSSFFVPWRGVMSSVIANAFSHSTSAVCILSSQPLNLCPRLDAVMRRPSLAQHMRRIASRSVMLTAERYSLLVWRTLPEATRAPVVRLNAGAGAAH